MKPPLTILSAMDPSAASATPATPALTRTAPESTTLRRVMFPMIVSIKAVDRITLCNLRRRGSDPRDEPPLIEQGPDQYCATISWATQSAQRSLELRNSDRI